MGGCLLRLEKNSVRGVDRLEPRSFLNRVLPSHLDGYRSLAFSSHKNFGHNRSSSTSGRVLLSPCPTPRTTGEENGVLNSLPRCWQDCPKQSATPRLELRLPSPPTQVSYSEQSCDDHLTANTERQTTRLGR